MTDLERLRAALGSRYTIDKEIGAGGMATVYLAIDPRHNRKVAVKVLRPELSASLGAQRFHREIEVAAQLQHPHILPLLDSGAADDFLFYVMPFVDGESLRERISKHGELPIHEAVRILVEIVDALAHAHSHRVVHRDIKPDNILLSGRHALVMDFGVAKAVSEATGRQQLTTAGVALGTPAYMAPEQATADPTLDHRVDIYAVGALAYELLSGHPPFAGRSPQEILAAHVTQAPEPVAKARASIPPALNDMVMRCLEKRPADRFQTAEELLAHLEPLMSTSASTTPAQTRPSKAVAVQARGNRALWFGLGALVIAAMAFGATLIPRDGPSLTLGRAQPLAFESMLEIEPSISPDGRHVAYSAGPLDRLRIFVRQQGGRAIALTSDSGPSQRRPVWSPDGSQLLFSHGTHLFVAPALGGIPRVVLRRDPPAGSVLGAAWSPDGQQFAYAASESLFTRPLSGGAQKLVAAGEMMSAPAWSPDGRFIAYVAGDPRFSTGTQTYFGNIAPTAIKVVRADGSAPPQTVVPNTALNVSPAWSPDSRALLFVSNRDGQRDIYRVAVSDGRPRGDVQRITSGLNPHSMTVSADARRIAYSAYTARSNIWGVTLRPGGVATMADARQITTGNQMIEAPSVSDDGQRLYYDSDRSGSVEVYRIAANGGEPEQLTNDSVPKFNPSESPDGRWVAFHSFKHGNRDVFVIPREGGDMVRVTSDSTQEQFPQWSPRGDALAFFQYGHGMRPTPHAVRRQADGTWSASFALDRVPSGGAMWWTDSTVLVRRPDTLMLRTLDGRNLGPLKVRRRDDPEFSTMITRKGQLYLRVYDRDGGSTFWRGTPDGGHVLIARLNDPLRPTTRSEFDTDGRMLYVTITDRQSDIFVAELLRR